VNMPAQGAPFSSAGVAAPSVGRARPGPPLPRQRQARTTGAQAAPHQRTRFLAASRSTSSLPPA
jgi:hypothetical protein